MIAPLFALPLFFATRANAQQAVTVVNDQPPAAQPPPPGQPVQNAQPAQNQMAPQPAPYQRTTQGTNGEIDDEGEGDPPQRVGFQLALRTGVSAPAGNAEQSAKQSDGFAWQVPIIVDVGGKIHPNIFIGGYLGLAIGGCGSAFDNTGGSCATARFMIGPEILVSIIPKGKVNPWVGYGIGLESAGISASNGGTTASGSYFGYELAHLMGGVDFRVSHVFGVGPFLDFGIGRYTSGSVTVNNVQESSGSITNPAWHEWITIGPRFVFFP